MNVTIYYTNPVYGKFYGKYNINSETVRGDVVKPQKTFVNIKFYSTNTDTQKYIELFTL